MKRALYLLCLGLWCGTALANPAGESNLLHTKPQASTSSTSSQALLQKVHAQLKQAAVVKGRFEQLKKVQGFKQPLRSTGTFVVAQERGIVWQVEQPFASTLVLTAERMLSKAADGSVQMDMQAADEPVLRTVNAMLFAVMSANVNQLQQMFEVTGQVQASGWTLHLRPRDALLAQWLHSIDLQGQAFVQKVMLREVRGDHSEIRIETPTAYSQLSNTDAALFSR